MKHTIHKADSRGHADHGWLNAWHSFSFAGYYDPSRIHFGALRVLNDDTIDGGMGFGKHPHDNMEIITIPLEGALEHGDDMGNNSVIRKGDVQVMSAGTGIVHSEKNASVNERVKLLQIWVIPNKRHVQPRYDQKTFSEADRQNILQTIVSPIGSGEGVEIHQDAWFSLGKLDEGKEIDYTLHKSGHGVYAFLLDGELEINGITLNCRDGLAVSEESSLKLKANTNAEILLMEIPLVLNN
jgi:redox-sensitive bicupin YhaK (pirin superfamily)